MTSLSRAVDLAQSIARHCSAAEALHCRADDEAEAELAQARTALRALAAEFGLMVSRADATCAAPLDPRA
jgi:hypothetical protein